MKELSIEEKAQRYDEALERARKLKENPQSVFNEYSPKEGDTICDYIFPELKESEDERIRKELLAVVNDLVLPDEQQSRFVSWLEKQKPTKNVHKEDEEVRRYIVRIMKQRDINVPMVQKALIWLEKKGEQNTNHKTMIVKFICKKDWHGIGDYYYGKIYNGYPCEKEQEGYDIYDDNHIPTFCNKEFIDEYFNIITEEKQGTPAKLSEEEQNKFAKGVLTSCALSFIDYLEAHKYEGKMCVSNGECEDIENAFHNAMWDRLHRYYCKYIENQGEQKPTIEMITPEESLGIDSETYNKIVDECIYGEQRYDDKVEPKFKVGDWITNGDYTWKIVEVEPLDYILQSQDGNIVDDTISQVDEQFHSFTIEDAKEAMYDKPAWSEDDEKIITGIINDIQKRLEDYPLEQLAEIYFKEIDWLKSLKQRIGG